MTHLVLLSLCAFRVWRLAGRDDLTVWLRAPLLRRNTPVTNAVLHGIMCSYCLGTWLALALVTWDHFHPVATWVLLLGAVSTLVGFLGTLDERVSR